MSATTWQAFVLAHGRGVLAHHLGSVLGQPAEAIIAVRRGLRMGGRRTSESFTSLFTRWHGRPPREDEWPTPRRIGGGYEWLGPELALLASLVGRRGVREIAEQLTARLRQLTGDARAERTRVDVQGRVNRIGLQAGADLVGGLTTTEAGRRVGHVAVIHSAIQTGRLRTFRVGHRHLIPHAEFERWLATREEPPAGHVRLASLCAPLGISSDSKLPEYAALGHIPGAVKVAGIATMRGVWYIPETLATQILEDARAGRPMPWHGKPLPGNQQAMWRKWQRRKHRRCQRCAQIWKGAAPTTFEAFVERYVSLSLGEKRHLTVDQGRRRRGSISWRARGSVAGRMRAAGLTVYEAARQLQQPTKWIRGWIRSGILDGGLARDVRGGEAVRITVVGMAMLRGLAAGEAAQHDGHEWLGLNRAAQLAGVCGTTVQRWTAEGEVVTKRGGRGRLFERTSLEARARTYWISGHGRRFKRPHIPAALGVEGRAA